MSSYQSIGRVKFCLPSFAKLRTGEGSSFDLPVQGMFGLNARAPWGHISFAAFESRGDVTDPNVNPLFVSATRYITSPSDQHFFELTAGGALKRNDLHSDGSHVGVSYWMGPSDGIVNFAATSVLNPYLIFQIDRMYSLMRYKKDVRKRAFELADEKGVDIRDYEKMDHETLQLLEESGETLFKSAFEKFRSDASIVKEVVELEEIVKEAEFAG